MYALRRGVGGLSSGTRVTLLSCPTVEPVRVRTLTPLPHYQVRKWRDQNGQSHLETFTTSSGHVEVEVPIDYLVRLRPRVR
jgi:hypothetical protein